MALQNQARLGWDQLTCGPMTGAQARDHWQTRELYAHCFKFNIDWVSIFHTKTYAKTTGLLLYCQSTCSKFPLARFHSSPIVSHGVHHLRTSHRRTSQLDQPIRCSL